MRSPLTRIRPSTGRPAWAVLLLGAALPLLSTAGRAAADEEPLRRVAFGSCASQEKPQPIWEAVVAARPDLFLFLGDNIYADTRDRDVMRDKYAKLAAMPGYQKLRATCPVLATWDDHDFGADDSGAEYPMKAESQRLFLDFFGEPADSPRRRRPGVYDARVFGPEGRRVQVILLDTRSFRSPLKRRPGAARGEGPYAPDPDPAATLLGEAQWSWLQEQLRVPAELRLIASSIQVVAEDHGWEKWMNFPRERDRLFRLIRDTGASGVIFLSGDRHLAELSMIDGGIGYPLYDLTSSGLNQAEPAWRPQEANRHRVGTMNWGDNFGLIALDWDRPAPRVRLQIRDVEGDIIIQRKIPLSTLRPGLLPTSGRKKLIEFGWDEPDTAFLRRHIAAMERTPFDGCVFHVNFAGADGKGGNFTWSGWGRRAFTEAELSPALDDLQATPFRRFTDNFLRFNTTPADVDWFDDFAPILANARLAARVSREGKCRGLLFDIEQYEGKLFDYRAQRDAKTRSWDEYAAQARRRGREVMEAFQEGNPDLTVLLTFGYSLPWAQSEGGKRPLAACDYGLLAPFLDGLVEATRGQARLVDGHELSYGYREPARFAAARRTMAEGLLPIVADAAQYRRVISIGFGLWMDFDWRHNGWDVEDVSRNYFPPEAFEASVRRALEQADEYVWIYTEQPRWW